MTAWETISKVIKSLIDRAQPGVNLLELDSYAATLIEVFGATSVNKNYFPKWTKAPFPATVCLNVNDGIAHGVPFDYKLQNGDLLTIDCGILVDNHAGDAGITIPIGKISQQNERLLRYTKRAIRAGIAQIKPGAKITEVGKAIELYAMTNGFIVNKRLLGHGIGKNMHEEPQIPMVAVGLEEIVIEKDGKKTYEYKEYDNTPVFIEGQIVCIEPYLTYKDAYGKLEADQWTLKTRDGRNSAFIEHMVRVTSFGNEVLTTHEGE